MKKRLAQNMFFAFLLQFTSIIFPLITAPYLSEILGTTGLGKVNLSGSIVNWFAVFATFGTLAYGVKEVAKIKDNKHELSLFFSEMMIIKLIATIIVLIIYIPLIIFIGRFRIEFWLYIVQGSALILNLFSLDWFFQGIEEYRFISIRSILFKVLAIGAIFLLIKRNEHYVLYAAISIFALSASNLINFIYSRKHVKLSFTNLNLKKHLKPLFIFFISALVVSGYAIVDQIILGFIIDEDAVALFVRAKAINSIGMALLLTISNVMLPRLNNYFVTHKERYNELLGISADFVFLFSIPIVVGIFLLSSKLMFLFGGEGFAPATILLQIIIPTVFIVSIGTWCYQQRTVPLGKEKQGLVFQIIIAVISLVLNFSLLSTLGYIGVAISWVVAETIGLIVMLVYLYSKDHYNIFNLNQIKYLLASAVMGFFIYFMQKILPVSWLFLFVIIAASIVLYFLILFLLREKLLMFIIKKLIKKKENGNNVE